MAIVTLCSAGGSPGVTTTATGLAAAEGSLLVDADPHAAQSVLAGWWGARRTPSGGLMAMAEACRRGTDASVAAHEMHCGATGLRFLPGVGSAGAARVLDPVWPQLAAELVREAQRGTVWVDAGRLSSGGLPHPLVAATDQVLVVTRSSLRAVAALRLHVPPLIEAVGDTPVALVVVGPDRPYPAGEVAASVELALWASLPWDPRGAAVYSDGDPRPRRTALARAWEPLVGRVATSREVAA